MLASGHARTDPGHIIGALLMMAIAGRRAADRGRPSADHHDDNDGPATSANDGRRRAVGVFDVHTGRYRQVTMSLARAMP